MLVLGVHLTSHKGRVHDNGSLRHLQEAVLELHNVLKAHEPQLARLQMQLEVSTDSERQFRAFNFGYHPQQRYNICSGCSQYSASHTFHLPVTF